MRIFCVSDVPALSGFGRIAGAITDWFHNHGHQIVVGSLMYDGIHPHGKPYHIAALAGKDLWVTLTGIINEYQPDVVMCIQDFPYAVTLFKGTRVDWSKTCFFNITPIDGTPVFPEWVDLCDDIDGTMVISRFGVEAMRKAGQRVSLCHPGVDTGTFKPASEAEKQELRKKAGIAPDAFVLGMMAMNQGRKNIPATLEAFRDFCVDKPHARLLLDMDKVSAAGWNIPVLAKEIGLDGARLIFKEDLQAKGLTNLRDRFCLLDAHSVISHREGFGLPLLESQACKIATLALDWCSGTEICGEGKGVLIPCAPNPRYGTWGNAQDRDPDMAAFVRALNRLHDEPGYRAGVAEAGYQWAIQQTWEAMCGAVDRALTEAIAKHKQQPDIHAEAHSAIGFNHHPGVQPAAVSDEVRVVPDGNLQPAGGGDHPGGRLQPGLQPDGTDGQAVQGAAHRSEQGLCGDLQRGGARGEQPLTVLLEQRHDSPSQLVSPNGEGVR